MLRAFTTLDLFKSAVVVTQRQIKQKKKTKRRLNLFGCARFPLIEAWELQHCTGKVEIISNGNWAHCMGLCCIVTHDEE